MGRRVVNTVPGHLVEEVPDNAESDRRRGIKLVSLAPAKKRSGLRIDVEDRLLSTEAISPTRRRPASRNRDLFGNEPVVVSGAVIILATVAGLAIGFLIGRRHSS